VAYINGLGFSGRRSQIVVSSPTHYDFKPTNHKAGQSSFSAASSQTLHSDSMTFAKHFASPKQSINASSGAHGTYANGGMQPQSHYDHLADRRKTRTSARYDAVSDLIEDYTETQQHSSIPMQPIGATHYALQDNGPVQPGQYPTSVSESSMIPSASLQSSADQYNCPRAPQPRPAMAADVAAILRPGYAYAQLLPGKTLRLTLRTPNAFAWRPGQYVNLNVPSVKWWQSHPFTVASAYNADYPSSTSFKEAEGDVEKGLSSRRKGEERTMVLLLRARKGFTQALWDHVRIEREKQIRQIEQSTGVQYAHGEVAKTATGVHLRAIVDGPFGSAQRTKWGMHSSVVIICGGSGISYGMAALEYMCAVLAGIKRERKFLTRRVRFVWILREYSHLQWVASALRRCVELVPPEMLQVDLYVTSTHAVKRQVRPAHQRANQSHDFPSSMSTYDTATLGGASHDDGASMYQARFTEGTDQEDYEINAYDLTQFDGEDTSAPTAAEAKISERVQKEGKLRRAHTRRATIKRNKRRAEAAKEGKSQEPNESVSNDDAIVRAAQKGIHERATRQQMDGLKRDVRYPPPSPMPTMSREQHDIGRQRIDEQDDTHEHVAHDQTNHQPQFQLHPASPQQIDSNNGYFTPTPHNGHASPSPFASPALTPAHSFGRYTPDPLGSSHSLPYNPASSTTHLNASYAHPPRSALGRHIDGDVTPDYHDGEVLQPTPSATDVPIDLDEDEDADMSVVAELARPGYPKLDRIVREEVQQSVGRVLVASCGPVSLGRLIRSIVSKQIDLKAIRAGRPNAQINVATESYEWGG
jgi:hypothetical protein